MAETMQFDLVSPEAKLASELVDSVSIPGAEGDIVAMPNHTPFLTTLRPGFITVTAGSNVTEYLVTGGFAEVSAEGASVLAEQAVLKADVTLELLAASLAQAEEALEAAHDEAVVAAAKQVNDLKTLTEQLGL
ncbi:MAG: ATP synthase F1 subunit epsilon [Rhodobacteraceae bacterium]|nr:ATP synthase F1 subunit epsilon [Paracoccaceae bacterium]